jgi:hypothetical protein
METCAQGISNKKSEKVTKMSILWDIVQMIVRQQSTILSTTEPILLRKSLSLKKPLMTYLPINSRIQRNDYKMIFIRLKLLFI